MELYSMLGMAWYKIMGIVGLVGVIIFYAMYRREQ